MSVHADVKINMKSKGTIKAGTLELCGEHAQGREMFNF